MSEIPSAPRPEPRNGLEWFGRELEEALRHHGAAQRQLAHATGYKAPYVTKVKQGKALASPHFAEGCDRFFNTSGYFARMRTRISQHGHPEWFVPYLLMEEKAAQVLDFSPFLVIGVLQTFTLLTFDDGSPPVLYSEAQGLGRVIDSASVVATGTSRFERLRADALSPEQSLRALREAIKEYA
ncbi:Scr1 family TA system antitoxin-like transcriptional regulator [Streptomyces sp. NPDC059788]|uniref:Scr1 family TA system antitoxin-like transcriptional regulator n=1 Tax=Streptomyces sp. NPDC059788 TaxID=3346948 RepID=UPI00365C690C